MSKKGDCWKVMLTEVQSSTLKRKSSSLVMGGGNLKRALCLGQKKLENRYFS